MLEVFLEVGAAVAGYMSCRAVASELPAAARS